MKIGLELDAAGCFETELVKTAAGPRWWPTEAANARRHEVYAAGVAKLKEQVDYLSEIECVFIPCAGENGIASFRCFGILKTERLKGCVV